MYMHNISKISNNYPLRFWAAIRSDKETLDVAHCAVCTHGGGGEYHLPFQNFWLILLDEKMHSLIQH